MVKSTRSKWLLTASLGIGVIGISGLTYGLYRYYHTGRAYQTNELHEGSTGPAVVALKRRLTTHGFGPDEGEEDDVFGPLTRDAVERFQDAYALPVTGLVTATMWTLLVQSPKKVQARSELAIIIDVMKKLGYTVEENGKWNIVGVRANTGTTNSYDDEMHIFRMLHDGTWDHASFKITTDPGLYWLLNPPPRLGITTAMAAGQYPDAYEFGLHLGMYEALVQTGRVRIYQDRDKDAFIDYDPNTIVTCNGCGVNIHKGSREGITVDRASGGCQVFARSNDFEEFMRKMKESGQTRFTYTLLDEMDLIDEQALMV